MTFQPYLVPEPYITDARIALQRWLDEQNRVRCAHCLGEGLLTVHRYGIAAYDECAACEGRGTVERPLYRGFRLHFDATKPECARWECWNEEDGEGRYWYAASEAECRETIDAIMDEE
jgi:hypothetical protein